MKFTNKISANDYIEANRLHISKTIWVTVGALGCFALFSAYMSLNGSLSYSSTIFSLLLTAYYIFWYLYIMPRNTRRIFDQQKKLHGVFEYEADANGLRYTSGDDKVSYDWSELYKWKSNEHVVTVYLSEGLFEIIRRGSFTDDSQFTEFCGYLSKNINSKKNNKSSQSFWTSLAVALLVIFGAAFLFGFFDAFSDR